MINIAFDTDTFIWLAKRDFVYLNEIINSDRYSVILYPINIIELLPDLIESYVLKCYEYLKSKHYEIPIEIIKSIPDTKDKSSLKFFEYFKNNGIRVSEYSWCEYSNNYLENINDFVDYNSFISSTPYYDSTIALEASIEGHYQRLKQIGCQLLIYRLYPEYIRLICGGYVSENSNYKKEAYEFKVTNIDKELEKVKDICGEQLENKIKELSRISINIDDNKTAIEEIRKICIDDINMIKVIKSVAEYWFPQLKNYDMSDELERKYILLPLMYMVKVVLESIMESDKRGPKLYGPKQLKKGCIKDPEFLYSFLITDTKYFFTFDKAFFKTATWILDNLTKIFNSANGKTKILIKTDEIMFNLLNLMEEKANR